MNTLVIYTHPNHNSLNHALLTAVEAALKAKVATYRIIDLYKENFNPVLVYNEDFRRRDMHKDPEMAKYREALLWADRIVMIYPIFWGRPPAMLLGFVDRLFASNFAYRDSGGLLPEGLLKGKEVVVVSTMKGPTHYMRLLFRNAHQILMRRALFNFVGIKKVKFFEFGGLEGSTPKEAKNRQRAFKTVGKYFSLC